MESKESKDSNYALETRVAILEERLVRTNSDLKELSHRMDKSISEIKDMIEKIQNRPNSVQEFIEKNWKSVVLALFAVMGTNATIIESLSRVFTGT